MKVVDAAIVVADLEGSSEFANLASLEEYNRLVEKQRVARLSIFGFLSTLYPLLSTFLRGA